MAVVSLVSKTKRNKVKLLRRRIRVSHFPSSLPYAVAAEKKHSWAATSNVWALYKNKQTYE